MTKRVTYEAIQEAFMKKVQIASNGCWEWQGSRQKRQGYGIFKSFLLKESLAHRVSYRIFRGDIPERLFILHKCNNTCCVNPEHLYAGTQLENVWDRERAGRHKHNGSKGEKNPNASLTEQQVREIRQCYKMRGVTLSQLAMRFGVSYSLISGRKKTRSTGNTKGISMAELTLRGHLRYAAMDLDRCITEWKDEKFSHTESKRTQEAYDFHIDRFRALLQIQGLDLDSPAALIAPLARRYCAASEHRESVTANTFNQRRSILSSFYRFAVQHEVLPINPIERIKSRKRDKPHAARPLPFEQVRENIGRIDTTTCEGMRDKALLAIALTTGRRASEIAALCLSHLRLSGGRISVTWARMKGNEHETQGLDEKTSHALLAYLDALYGGREAWLSRMHEAPDAPLWLSFSRNPAYSGKRIGTRAIERLCRKHLGTSKAHAIRHTFAVRMHKRGATLAEIGRALHHKSLKTTSEYMDEQLEYENPYADDLAQDFGI